MFGGSTPTKINVPINHANGDVDYHFRISADSKYVVYQADQSVDSMHEVFSVPIAGGVSVKLNSDLSERMSSSSFKLSADSLRVVYKADQNTVGVRELFSVPIT